MRRRKTYAAEGGGAFEYYFVGKRAALASDPFSPATEYIFDVTTDGCPKLAVSVFLTRSALLLWKCEHRRELSDPEQYAAAKMRLFRAFDEWEQLPAQAKRVAIEADQIAELLLRVGVD